MNVLFAVKIEEIFSIPCFATAVCINYDSLLCFNIEINSMWLLGFLLASVYAGGHGYCFGMVDY